jgi:hypothetical protein
MGLITKKQIKAVRLFILSNNLEYILLMLYIFSFTIIMLLKKSTMDGSGLRTNNVQINDYQFHQDLNRYFNKEKLDNIQSIGEIWEYLETLQTQRLWLPSGERSPYWPLGSTRIV